MGNCEISPYIFFQLKNQRFYAHTCRSRQSLISNQLGYPRLKSHGLVEGTGEKLGNLRK